VSGFVPVQCNVGLLLVLAVKPQFAPAVLGCAGCDAVLDILKSLVESILDTSELLDLLLLEWRN